MNELTPQNIKEAFELLKANSDVKYIDPYFYMYCGVCKEVHLFNSESPEMCRKALIKELNSTLE